MHSRYPSVRTKAARDGRRLRFIGVYRQRTPAWPWVSGAAALKTDTSTAMPKALPICCSALLAVRLALIDPSAQNRAGEKIGLTLPHLFLSRRRDWQAAAAARAHHHPRRRVAGAVRDAFRVPKPSLPRPERRGRGDRGRRACVAKNFPVVYRMSARRSHSATNRFLQSSSCKSDR